VSKGLRMSEDELAARQARGSFKLAPVPIPETSVQDAVLTALQYHPRVAWAERFNVGAGRFIRPDGSITRFIRFGFRGQSDILGQLVTGQFLAVEVKSPGARTLPERLAEQVAFHEIVRRNNGVAFFADSIDDVARELAAA
jgi:hypothetical protein